MELETFQYIKKNFKELNEYFKAYPEYFHQYAPVPPGVIWKSDIEEVAQQLNFNKDFNNLLGDE